MKLKNKLLLLLTTFPNSIVNASQALYGVPQMPNSEPPTVTNKLFALFSLVLAFCIGILVFIRKKIRKK